MCTKKAEKKLRKLGASHCLHSRQLSWKSQIAGIAGSRIRRDEDDLRKMENPDFMNCHHILYLEYRREIRLGFLSEHAGKMM